MNHRKILLMALGLVIFSSTNARAGDVKIIANPNVKADTISVRELQGIFLGERTSLEGVHVEPVFEKDGPVHETFLRQYLGRSSDDLQRYYLALQFSGRGTMPTTVASDAEVVAYVAGTRGAIGYVSAGTNAEGVKTLTVAVSFNSNERKLLTRVDPVYPEELYKRSIGGTVRLKVTIAANGSVEHAELLGGNPVLGDAAIAAVQKWKYAAASSRTVTEITIPFDPNR